MKTAIVYILEMILCSAALHLFYRLLVERRVRYWGCRLYLLAAALLPAVIPALDIRLWEDRIVYYEAPAEQAAATAAQATVGEQIAVQMPANIWEPLLAALYAAGVAAMAIAMLRQAVRLRRIARGGVSTEDMAGCRIVRSDRISEPFSFLRTVYLPASLDAAECGYILLHEAAHVRRGHSVERIAMEAMKAAMWFNPFVWTFARLLAEVQEYEADREVIDSGCDKAKYANFIFKQTFGYSPDIANGLRSSLTKKRFKMMTTRKPSRKSLLRLAGSLPVIAALTMLFSVRAQATHYVAVESGRASGPETQQPAPKGEMSATITLNAVSKSKRWSVPAVDSPIEVTSFADDGYEPSADHAPILLYDGKEVPIDYLLERKFSRSQLQMSVRLMDYDKAVERFGKRAKWGVLTVPRIYTLAEILADPQLADYRFVVDDRIVDRSDLGITDADVMSLGVSAAGEPLANYGKWGLENGVVYIHTAKGAATAGSGETPYVMAEKMPVFGEDGDLNDFRKYIASKVSLPAEAAAAGLSDVRVIVRFVVEKDGSIEYVEHLAGPAVCAEQVIDAVKSTSGKWTGGIQDGKGVRVTYVMPVEFTSM